MPYLTFVAQSVRVLRLSDSSKEIHIHKVYVHTLQQADMSFPLWN